MQIRKYKDSDFEKVRQICFETARGKQFQTNKELVCTLFCDYYLTYEKDNCFIISAENDEAVGYVFCAENFDDYINKYFEVYFSKVKSLSKKEAFIKRCEKIFYRKIAKTYPAHLHIDILEEYRGKGNGKGLIRKLLDSLKSKGVKGIYLTVDTQNQKAIKFYYKLGFKKLRSIFGKALIMCKKI